MRTLLGLALAATLVFATGCGPQEPEGLANQPAKSGTDGTKTDTPAPVAGTDKKEDKPADTSGAQTDVKPEKPVPGPGSEPTLGK